MIVGDPQQLPPTSIFARQDSDDSDTDNEIERVVAEFCLDVARTAFQPLRELLWHYRSRHGSLIAFSNRHFYDDRLIVFPSPQEGHPDYGVRLVPITGQYRASINVPEAQAVAHAAVDFMAKNPDKSLGIVALNQPQRDLILAEMDRLFIRDTVAERYRARWQGTLEPFFVKNLENVQGDERDAIFISTVYGPDEHGNLMQRFTLINGAAGDRRLNVYSPAPSTASPSFRPCLQTRSALIPRLHAEPAFSRTIWHSRPLGASIRATLLTRSATASSNGSSRSAWRRRATRSSRSGRRGFLDRPRGPPPRMALRIPLLGIECDGAAYHSSLSARDRDRLRQQILESLGWTIYRVWSTDWFREQNRELTKMVDFIERTLADRHKQQAEAEAQHPWPSSTRLMLRTRRGKSFSTGQRRRGERRRRVGSPEPGKRLLFNPEEPETEMPPSVGANGRTAQHWPPMLRPPSMTSACGSIRTAFSTPTTRRRSPN